MYIIGKEEVEAVRRVIESQKLFRYGEAEGGETDKFESEWSDKIGVKHTIAMTSGTAASRGAGGIAATFSNAASRLFPPFISNT